MIVDILFWIVCELAPSGPQVKDMYYEIINGKGLLQHAPVENCRSWREDATAIRAVAILIAQIRSHVTARELGGKRSYEEEANEVVGLCTVVWRFAESFGQL